MIQLNAEDPHRKIKLEDIERDNLISERRAQGKETLVGQHTQHLRPPAIHAQNAYQVSYYHFDVYPSIFNLVLFILA